MIVAPPVNLLPVLGVCLAISIVLNVLLRYPADWIGLVDAPGGRKRHQGRVPLVGGASIFLAFLVGLLLLELPADRLAPSVAGMGLLFLCGVVDDLVDLRGILKLGVQLLAALVMVFWAGVVVQDMGNIAGMRDGLGIWGYPFTLLVVVGLINAVNMMDGVDGLAGGVVLTSLFWLCIVAVLSGMAGAVGVLLALMVAILGFLAFNFRHPWRGRASVFLGDSGTLLLGFVLAWVAVRISQHEAMAISPVSMAWILALPVVDTVSLMVRRVSKGRSPLAADRDHLHHVFQRAGISPGGTTLLLVVLNLLFGGIGVVGALAGVPDTLLFVGFLLLFAAHFWFVRRAWKSARFMRRFLMSRAEKKGVPEDA